MNPNTCFFVFCFLFLMAVSCDNAELPVPVTPEFCNDIEEPFYNTTVDPIMETSCSYAGCHSGGVVSGADYDSYKGLEEYLGDPDNLSFFRSKVLGELKDHPIKGMPPDNSPIYPNSLKDSLTQEELEIIECWLDAGFPEG